jgi:hypothetical protein
MQLDQKNVQIRDLQALVKSLFDTLAEQRKVLNDQQTFVRDFVLLSNQHLSDALQVAVDGAFPGKNVSFFVRQPREPGQKQVLVLMSESGRAEVDLDAFIASPTSFKSYREQLFPEQAP